MTSAITACPKCQTLVLDDTELCPHCHFVLIEGADHLVKLYSTADSKYDGSKDVPCRECEAMNRDGLVRCWQCGAFLREEIEHVYQEMKAHPVEAVQVESAVEQSENQSEAVAKQEAEVPFADFSDDDDDDFELSEEVNMFQVDEAVEPDSTSQESADSKENAEQKQEDDAEEEKNLFDLAVTEQKESQGKAGKRKQLPRHRTFLVKCPSCSSNVRVQNYHQGKTGHCPKCSLPFMVPVLTPPKKKPSTKKGAKAKVEVGVLPENQIIASVSWYEIKEKNFKPKAKSLAGKGEKVDIILRDGGLLFSWAEKKGLMGASAASTEKTRGEIAGHLLASKPLDKLPCSRNELIPIDQLEQIKFAWPAVDAETPEENLLAGIAIFGEHAIAIQLPNLPMPTVEDAENSPETPAHPGLMQSKKKGKAKKPKKKKVKAPEVPPIRFLTLTISQYRKLRGWLEKSTNQQGFLLHAAIPQQDVVQQWKCELSGEEFDALASADFYLEDSAIQTTTVGWACQCGEVMISEKARAEQNFGGKKPAGLAKAKCPKCEQKFGQHPLYHLTSIVAPESIVEKVEKPKAKNKKAAKKETSDQSGSKEKSKKSFSLKSMFKKKKTE